jgi:chemotaxis response regulator CheB
MKAIRVLILEDSPVVQIVLKRILSRQPDIVVAGAVDFVSKPSQNVEKRLTELRNDIISKIRIAEQSQVKVDFLRHKPGFKLEKDHYMEPTG